MKKILITGKDSYIGTSVEKWLMREPDKYSVDTIDMRDGSWKEHDFSQYDVVFHVAGIAHVKETREIEKLYYLVNRDLAYDTASKAKKSGVGQFVFLSSMSVYGINKGHITINTELNPNTAYGKSKAEAEELINELSADCFSVSIIRPPMIYGPGCKGNYPKLAKLVCRTPVFPEIGNKRSMLFINNLSEFIKNLIDDRKSGLFFPQNFEYVDTSEMARFIAEARCRKIRTTKIVTRILKSSNIRSINKVFGDLTYDKSMSECDKNYNTCSFRDSIIMTEENRKCEKIVKR